MLLASPTPVDFNPFPFAAELPRWPEGVLNNLRVRVTVRVTVGVRVEQPQKPQRLTKRGIRSLSRPYTTPGG